MTETLTPQKRTFLKVIFMYVAATLLFAACGEQRSRQSIKVNAGETVFTTSAEDYTKRTAVGGELNPSVGQPIYLKETVSVESLRRILSAGITSEEMTKMQNLANQRFFALTVMVKSATDSKYMVRWLDDREGRKPVETDLTYDAKTGVYSGKDNDASMTLSCVLETCDVLKLTVSVGDIQIPYLIIARVADVSVTALALPNNEKTKGEFIEMPDKRQRHHLVALMDEAKSITVLNTVGVVNDVSRFAISVESQNLPASLRVWGPYARVDHTTSDNQKITVSSHILPSRSKLDVSTTLEENGANHFVLAMTYTEEKVMLGNILLRFDLK